MSLQVTASSVRPTAVVVAVQLPDVGDAELASSIAELERLARTLGLDPVGRLTQRRGHLAPGMVLGEGKLAELAAWTGGTGVVPAYEKPGRRKPARDGADDEDEDEDEGEGEDVGDDTGDAAAAATDGVDGGEPRGGADAAGATARDDRERDDDRAGRGRGRGSPGGSSITTSRRPSSATSSARPAPTSSIAPR
jgi:GTP-binding protein HflX